MQWIEKRNEDYVPIDGEVNAEECEIPVGEEGFNFEWNVENWKSLLCAFECVFVLQSQVYAMLCEILGSFLLYSNFVNYLCSFLFYQNIFFFGKKEKVYIL